MHKFLPLIWVTVLHGAISYQEWDKFVESLIGTWKLNSPTIIGAKNEKFIEFCRKHQWVLCLMDDMEASKVAEHLSNVHKLGKQDGILLIGVKSHQKLLGILANDIPNESLFTRNYPVFMPTSYQNHIKLRLDSNVLFYEESGGASYKLNDIFAVKGGPPITLKVGKWDKASGLTLHTTMNRWERRTDLGGASLINVFTPAGNWASPIKDQNGTITGSKGYIPDKLFYITDNLNLTIETLMVTGRNRLLKNGSWDGAVGVLLRKEADVCTRGLGITLQRSDYIDMGIQILFITMGFHAAPPRGSALDVWSFVNVFGLPQWMTYFSLLVLVSFAVQIANKALDNNVKSMKYGAKENTQDNASGSPWSSSLTMVALYSVQMGEHPSSKFLTPKILTLTLSILTLIMFGYYANDITADMTAGAPPIPIRNFEDVVHHGYRVVVGTQYYAHLFSTAKPGSWMRRIKEDNLLEEKENISEAFKEAENVPKTLLYYGRNRRGRGIGNLTLKLPLDNYLRSFAGFGFQKDSEFLQGGNSIL